MNALPSVQRSSDLPRIPNHDGHERPCASSKKTGGNFTPICETQAIDEIRGTLVSALRTVNRKRLAKYAGVTEETAKSWGQNGNLPRTEQTMKAARKAAQIESAIYEILRGGNKNPHPERLVDILLRALTDIANMKGKPGSAARKALARYNEARGRA